MLDLPIPKPALLDGGLGCELRFRGVSVPEIITRAMPALRATGVSWIGGYANTFAPVPENWSLDRDRETDGLLALREDLDPERYAAHAADWLAQGATVVGGCCGTRPSHTARLRELFDD